jgi:hypothetical protein
VSITDYKVTFLGENGEAEVTVASEYEYLDAETSDEVIEAGLELAYLIYGEDFRDRLDTYAIFAEPAI